MAKRFSELFSESWKEYKENYKVFLLIMFLFIGIPSFINYFVSIPLSVDIIKLGEKPSFEATMEVILNHMNTFVLSSIIGFIALLLSLFCSVALLYGSLNKKRLINFKDSLKGGKQNFFRYLGFSIVICVFLLGLSLLFIIPALIFGVFWCFSFFIFIKKEKGVIESLKESYHLIKRKWWKTFGYLVLIGIICFLIILAFSIIFGLINIALNPGLFKATMSKNYSVFYTTPIWYVNDIISLIGEFLGNAVTTPFILLFMKNFYLDRVGKKK